MQIIIREDGYVDFAAPICTTDDQSQKILVFLDKEFGPLEIEQITEPKRKGFSKSKVGHWTPEQLQILLSHEDETVLSGKLKRSTMSIRMMRGWWVPAFLSWCQKNNKIANDLTTIKRFKLEGD